MKTKLFAFVAVLTLTLAGASQVLAQSGIVKWSQEARTCVRAPGSAASTINSAGGITFSTSAFGDIKLVCSVSSLMSGTDGTTVNAFGLTFNNPNGFVGGVDKCAIRASFEENPYNSRFPILDGSFSTNGTAYTGRNSVDSPIFDTLNFSANYYDVFIDLSRVQGATCNPVVFVTFVEEVIQ